MRRVAIQMDPLASINPRTDTTLLLGVEAIRRGYQVYHYLPGDLTFKAGELTARARPVDLRNDPGNYFTAGDATMLNLQEVDVVLMRQDPPFDMAYITATHLLEMLYPKTLVVNDPAAVRNAPEKLFMFHFPQFVPPTLITRDVAAVEALLEEHGQIVIKPLYGYAGQSVFSIKKGDTNLHALLEMFLGSSKEPVIAQRFLPEIKSMDKRIIVIDGHVTAVLGRVPAQGDIRANMRAGGTGVKVEATERDLLIGETVGKELASYGILLAGLDVIGEYLTEINVTCPTGFVKSNAIYGLKQESLFWDAVEKRLSPAGNKAAV
jgi:glutathione synthase